MYREVSTLVKPLTPQFASYISGLPTFEGDRDREGKTGKARIAWLETKLHDGMFFTPNWDTFTFNGQDFRINGGHSSFMLSGQNGHFPKGMKVFHRHFECDTEQDVALLFSQFDSRRSLRTIGDNIKAHKATEEGLRDKAPSTVGKAINGAAFYLCGCGDYARMDEEARVLLVHEYPEFIEWANQFLGTRRLCGVGTVAAMFNMFNTDKENATLFWTEVQEESNPNVSNPTRKLATFLRSGIVEGEKWEPRAYYVKSIHAAGAWAHDETTALRYVKDAPLPKLRWEKKNSN